MKFEAVIFDMDGTITDTEHLWRTATDMLIARYTIELNEEKRLELLDRIHGLAMREACTYIKEYTNALPPIEELVIYKKQLAHELYHSKGVTFIPGFERFHAQLRAASLKTGIATNADMATLATTDKLLNLAQFFGTHMYSIEVVSNRCKPKPDIYLHAADKLGVKPQFCIAIEDSAHGIAAAKAAGMRCIGINTSGKPAQLKEADLIVEAYDHIDLEHWLHLRQGRSS